MAILDIDNFKELIEERSNIEHSLLLQSETPIDGLDEFKLISYAKTSAIINLVYTLRPYVKNSANDYDDLVEHMLDLHHFDGMYSDGEDKYYIKYIPSHCELMSLIEIGNSVCQSIVDDDRFEEDYKDRNHLVFIYECEDSNKLTSTNFKTGFDKIKSLCTKTNITLNDIKDDYNELSHKESNFIVDINLSKYLQQCKSKSLQNTYSIPSIIVPNLSDDYNGYLTYIHGELLYLISKDYPWQMYGMNVRMEIEGKRSKVNQEVIKTIKADANGTNSNLTPKNFFAFNNGLVIIAQKVLRDNSNNISGLERVSIVNGAQTTGSVREALRQLVEESKNIPDLYIPVKIIEIESNTNYEKLGENVCLFANKQNKVTGGSIVSRHEVWGMIQDASENTKFGWFIEHRSDLHRLRCRQDQDFAESFPNSMPYDHVIITLALYHGLADICCDGPATSTRKWLDKNYEDTPLKTVDSIIKNTAIDQAFITKIVNTYILYTNGLRETLSDYIKTHEDLKLSPSKQVLYISMVTQAFSKLSEDIDKDLLRCNQHLLDRWVDLMTEVSRPITELLRKLNDLYGSNLITYLRSKNARLAVMEFLNQLDQAIPVHQLNPSFEIKLIQDISTAIRTIKNWTFYEHDYQSAEEPEASVDMMEFDESLLSTLEDSNTEVDALESLLNAVYLVSKASSKPIQMISLLKYLSLSLERNKEDLWDEVRMFWLAKFRAGLIRIKDFQNMYKGKSHDVVIYYIPTINQHSTSTNENQL